MLQVTTQRQMLLVFAAAVAVRLGFHVITGFTADSAFITFRYADNLASGLGFVYNEGERVLATSTPLFTFIIALFRLVSFPAVSAALLVSVLSAGFTAVILLRLAQLLRFTHLAALPALAYILFPQSLPAETAGMEVALFSCLTTAAIYYHHRHATVYSLAMATLAVLTRPEGAILLLILIADAIIRHRDAIVSYLAVPVSLLLPWIGFALYYFGRVMPRLTAGRSVSFNHAAVAGPFQRFVYVMGFDSVTGWVLFVLAIAGASWLNRKQNFGWTAILWLAGLIALCTASSALISPSNVALLYPMYLLFAGAGLLLLCEVAGFTPGQFRAACRWAITLVVVIIAIRGIAPARHYRNYQSRLDNTLKAAGEYVFQRSSAADVLATEDIGYVGYYSHLKILDREGLISPEARPYIRSKSPLQLLLDYRPAWVVTNAAKPENNFTHDPEFRSRFVLEQQFGGDEGDRYDLWHERGQ